MKTRRMITIGALSVAALIALAGFKGNGGFCHRGMDEEGMKAHSTRMVNHLLDDLDATDAQRSSIVGIKDELLKEGLELKGQHAALHAEMLTILRQDNPDAVQVHAQVDTHLERARTFAHDAADAALEVHRTLTPEQRAQLADKLEKRFREHNK